MAKLRGLVRSVDTGAVFLDGEDAGAALTADGAIWSLVGRKPTILDASRALGRSSLHGGPTRIVLEMNDRDASRVAAIAATLARPPQVWVVRGGLLESVIVASLSDVVRRWNRADAAAPSHLHASSPTLTPDMALLIQALAERVPLVDAELDDRGCSLSVLGLDIGSLFADDRGSVLELGVGRVDREARLEIEGARIVDGGSCDHHVAAVAAVAAEVAQRRRADAPPHPARTLRRERWLRRRLIGDPTLAGFDRTAHFEPLRPLRRPSRLDEWAMAAARSTGDDRTVLACAVGPDVALAAEAAEIWLSCAASATAGPLVVAVPRRDAIGLSERLIGALHLDLAARLLPIDEEWME